MRVLVHVTETTFLRHFSGVIRSLARRGHTVRIAVSEPRPDLPLPAALKEVDRVSFTVCPPRRADEWGARIAELRALRDYLRYLEPPFEHASKLRGRALKKLVKAMSGGVRSHVAAACPRCGDRLADEDLSRLLAGAEALAGASAPASAEPLAAALRLDSLLALVEETIPSDRTIEAFIRGERPDVFVVTPLVRIGSHQADYVKSARALGVPTVFPVFSWDNLSTKGLIHVMPDRVLVWNEWQRREAIDLHRVPGDRVEVIGAPRFDPFFAMKPKLSRARFCRKKGLDPDRPIVTYLCSSNFVAGRERDFVARWVDEVRRDPALAACNIVVRPHPREAGQWKDFRLPGARVAVAFPRSISVDQSLYDTVYHSAAVVGLNTSAQIEAGIVGRPVLTLLASEFAQGQQGTLHFRYLLREHGGFVEVAADFAAHRRQLAAAVADGADVPAMRGAIEAFVRPLGRERRVTPIMVGAIEAAARRGAGRPELAATRAWQHLRARLTGLRRRAATVIARG